MAGIAVYDVQFRTKARALAALKRGREYCTKRGPCGDHGGTCSRSKSRDALATISKTHLKHRQPKEGRMLQREIRRLVSIGGDTDTICAIGGGVAEALYGIPQKIADETWNRIDDHMKDVVTRVRDRQSTAK